MITAMQENEVRYLSSMNNRDFIHTCAKKCWMGFYI